MGIDMRVFGGSHVFYLCVLNSLGVSIFKRTRFQVIRIDADIGMVEERT